MLGVVVDRRGPRGKIYGQVCVLAAVSAGAKNFREISDQVADLPQSLLRKLGGTWCWLRRMFRVPSKDTVRLGRPSDGLTAARDRRQGAPRRVDR
jgi:hypothetical protein